MTVGVSLWCAASNRFPRASRWTVTRSPYCSCPATITQATRHVRKLLPRIVRGPTAPDLCLFMGDQVYLDLPTIQAFDEDPKWLAKKFEQDYVRNWFSRGFTEGLGLGPLAFIPDDHEYWNNFPHVSPFIQNSWSEGRTGQLAPRSAGLLCGVPARLQGCPRRGPLIRCRTAVVPAARHPERAGHRSQATLERAGREAAEHVGRRDSEESAHDRRCDRHGAVTARRAGGCRQRLCGGLRAGRLRRPLRGAPEDACDHHRQRASKFCC